MGAPRSSSPIDRFFGIAEAVVGGLEGVSRSVGEPGGAGRGNGRAGRARQDHRDQGGGDRGRSAQYDDKERGGKDASLARRAKSPYRVVESIDSESGRTLWVVTDGHDRAECSSAEFASKVLVSLG